MKEINKLFGKRTVQQDNILSDASEESSDDDGDELNKQIAALRKLIDSNSALLRGEAGPESVIEDDALLDDLEDGEKIKTDEAPELAAMKVAQKREQIRQDQLDEQKQWVAEQNANYEKAAEEKNQRAGVQFQEKKDDVLKNQIRESHEKAQKFHNELTKKGASGEEVGNLMDQIEHKMGDIEAAMKDDLERSNETIQRRLAARRNRRKKMEEKLQVVEEGLQEDEQKVQQEQDQIVEEIAAELNQELKVLDQEHVDLKGELDQVYVMKKQDMLEDFNERLKDAKDNKNFKDVLAEYQKKQMDVDKELQK